MDATKEMLVMQSTIEIGIEVEFGVGVEIGGACC